MIHRPQVLAFRAAGHHLDGRLPQGGLLTAVGAVGLRDVQGSGALGLHARVEGTTGDEIPAGLADGSLFEVISARGADTLIPAADVDVFTVGTLPSDEASLRVRLKPCLAVLDRSGRSATEAMELAKAVARDALSLGPLDIGSLSGALTTALPELSPMCRGRCGVEHIEQALFDLVGASGVWRQSRMDGSRSFVAMEWPEEVDSARDELVRRYLRCYGPSKPADFAQWCGIGTPDARRRFGRLGLTQVDRGRFLLSEDVERFRSPPSVSGVRIIPPRDAYLLDRDRAMLVPGRDHQRRIWRAIPTDGVILADGVPVATWRPRRTGSRLILNVETISPLSTGQRADLDLETAAVAELRGCTNFEVRFA